VTDSARVPLERSLIDARVLRICAWSVLLALATGFVAQALVGIIGLVTNIAFYGRLSTQFVSPANNHRGWLVLFIPEPTPTNWSASSLAAICSRSTRSDCMRSAGFQPAGSGHILRPPVFVRRLEAAVTGRQNAGAPSNHQ
jgi:hypothetical protein